MGGLGEELTMIWEFQSPTLVCSYSLASASVVSQAYILVSLIIELYIYRSGHGIETHLRSNLAQLVEGYGLGIAMDMLASDQPLSMAITYRRGCLFSSHIQICVDISGVESEGEERESLDTRTWK